MKYTPQQVLSFGKPTGVAIELSVVFGNPGRNCAGSGICKVIPANQTQYNTSKCNKVKATMLWKKDHHFKFIVDQEQLCAQRYSKWKQQDVFVQEEDFQFPLWINNLLGINGLISAAYYPMFYDNATGQFSLHLSWEEASSSTISYRYSLQKGA